MADFVATKFLVTLPLEALPLADELRPKVLDMLGPARISVRRRALYTIEFRTGPVIAIEATGSKYWSAQKLLAITPGLQVLVARLLMARAGPTIKPDDMRLM